MRDIMPTIMSLAKMSQDAYSGKASVPGAALHKFRPSTRSWREGDGFQGAIFKFEGGFICSFAGTDDAQDVVADAKLFLGMNTSQYSNAKDFLQKSDIPAGSQIILAGHSLGGAIAQVIGNRLKLPFVTFNAPGVAIASRNAGEMAVAGATGTMAARVGGMVVSAALHPHQALQDMASTFYWVDGVNFRLGKDIVGCTGVHYGKVIEIPYGGGTLDVAAKHKIGTVLTALADSPYAGMQPSAVV